MNQKQRNDVLTYWILKLLCQIHWIYVFSGGLRFRTISWDDFQSFGFVFFLLSPGEFFWAQWVPKTLRLSWVDKKLAPVTDFSLKPTAWHQLSHRLQLCLSNVCGRYFSWGCECDPFCIESNGPQTIISDLWWAILCPCEPW